MREFSWVIVLGLGFFLIPSHSKAQSFDLNDVSFLMKLPVSRESDRLLRADEFGSKGVLLPRSIVLSFGVVNNASSESSRFYENLRAVSFRFDPVEQEIRIVWQPVLPGAGSTHSMTTEDAAVHTFYRLSTVEIDSTILKLRRLKTKLKNAGVTTDGLPLQVHPGFFDPRTERLFMEAFRKLMFEVVGEKNFYKVTAMKLLVEDNWWKFIVGFERRSDGVWEVSSIPRLGHSEVDIINESTEVNPATGFVDEIDASIFPMSRYPAVDDIRSIVSSSYRRSTRSSDANINDYPGFLEKIGATHRFQNPKITNPKSLDCAHCHLADAAQSFATKTFPSLREAVLSHPDKFLPPKNMYFNLENNTVARQSSKVMRAFGYFADRPSIMTRTIHDSAESAAFLNRQASSNR